MERFANMGCSADLHCWHSIFVASLPLETWLWKCLSTAAISSGDHGLFVFLLALFSGDLRTTANKNKKKQIHGISTMLIRAHLHFPTTPSSQSLSLFRFFIITRSNSIVTILNFGTDRYWNFKTVYFPIISKRC